MNKIRLVAFFGNYGREYENTRHNTAWLFCDSLALTRPLSWQGKFKGQFTHTDRAALRTNNASAPATNTAPASGTTPSTASASGTTPSAAPDPIYLLKPETYMNLSGESVLALAQFYKIPPAEILVVHDELELPLGTVSLKWSGGLGGHNGLRSMKDSFGTADFWRLRFGIGRPNHTDIAGYVLSNFTADEKIILGQIFPQAEELLEAVLRKGPESQAQNWKKRNLVPAVV